MLNPTNVSQDELVLPPNLISQGQLPPAADVATATSPSAEQYETLVHTIDGIVWEVDLATFQFTFVSRQAERFLGYPVGQWLTERDFWTNHMHPDDLRWAPAFCVAATERKQDHTFEYRMLAADGRVVWLRDMVTVVCASNGQPYKLRGVMVNVTAQKEYEAALAQSERRYRDLFDKASDALFIVDERDDRILDCNLRASELFGYSIEALCKMKVSDLEPPSMPRVMPRRVVHDVHTYGVTPFQVEACRADGSLLSIEITNAELEGQSGRVLSIVRDVTERNRLEMELRLAKETAETATRAKSDFLTDTSHEIASPVDTILGLANVLLDMTLTAPQRALVKTIRNNSQNMLALINDLLDISKVEAGLLRIEAAPFDVRECVCAVCESLMPEATKKGLDVSYEVAMEVPELVVGDVKRVRQVLMNLLANAIKFTEQGEVVIRVHAETAPLETAHYQVQFCVSDTGLGIAANQLTEIFQRYHQGEHTPLALRRKGLGLGLFISRQLVDLMQGELRAESAGVAGQGSRFYLTLPMAAVVLPQSAYLNRHHPELEDRRVLLVDDSETTRHVLQAQCRAWGMEVHATGKAAEALEWLRRGALFDVGLIDMYLPEMTGYELAAQVRELFDGGRLPLVVLSSVEQFVEPSTSLQIAWHLTKPVKVPLLYNQLMSLFKSTKS